MGGLGDEESDRLVGIGGLDDDNPPNIRIMYSELNPMCETANSGDKVARRVLPLAAAHA
jgi:hypothetical protein